MLIIGIAGGTGSGKTTVVKKIINKQKTDVVVIPQDSYYKDQSHLPIEERQELNFDHPDAIDFEFLVQQIKELKKVNLLNSLYIHILPVQDQKLKLYM